MIENLIHTAILAAFDAGQSIMEVYGQENFSIEYKLDHSPLTLADKHAHTVISEYLTECGIPVLSEEGSDIPFGVRKYWSSFWLVDPLDGTKEFINRNGDFTVNIALISDQIPVAGVIYAPVPDLLYYALPGYGSFRMEGNCFRRNIELSLLRIMELSSLLPERTNRDDYVIVASRSHQSKETAEFIEQVNEPGMKVKYVSKGSSLKFCLLAEGSADLYPRMGPTMEWDTAAGHAIASLAGCTVTDPSTGKALVYNKESLLNPFFVVERKRSLRSGTCL
jgi:3'(2'), 5'-bisphosphate nucleotidase